MRRLMMFSLCLVLFGVNTHVCAEVIEQGKSTAYLWFGPSKSYENVSAGQSFILERTTVLNTISILLDERNTSEGVDEIHCEVSDADWNVLEQSSAAGFDSGEEWVRFQFSGTTTLQQGVEYRFTVSTAGSDYYWISRSADVYADGVMYERRGPLTDAFRGEPDWDLTFRVETSSGPTPSVRSYVNGVFASKSAGGQPTSLFHSSDDVFLNIAYYNAAEGAVTMYILVADSVSRIVDFIPLSSEMGAGNQDVWVNKQYDSGNYTLNAVIMSPAGLCMAPHGYSFRVQSSVEGLQAKPMSLTRFFPQNTESSLYVKEIYASDPPPEGENYNSQATRVFSAGDTVYMNLRFHNGVQSALSAYWIVTDSAGRAVDFVNNTFDNAESGARYWYHFAPFAAGTYVFNVVMLGDVNNCMSLGGYTFYVE